MLIDTHAHLWWDSYQGDIEFVLHKAKELGVEKIISPGTEMVSSLKSVELAKKYPGQVYAAAGVHPEETVTKEFVFDALDLEKLIAENKEQIVAIGEIGIDLYSEEVQQTLHEQKQLFKSQIELAIKYELPVIVHTRNSFAETWEVLSSLPVLPKGQFHCFSVDEEAIKKVLSAGFYVSFCGNITWSKRVAKLVALVPDDRLLLETDSPLMVPRDKKGEPIGGSDRNEPSNVIHLAQKIAELRGQSVSQIEENTTKNAKTLYKL